MQTFDRASLRAQYEQTLHRLAAALELEYAEVKSMFGDIGTASVRAEKILGFFKSPEINQTLQEVIRISQEFLGVFKETTR